jgi:hypothetical protein
VLNSVVLQGLWSDFKFRAVLKKCGAWYLGFAGALSQSCIERQLIMLSPSMQWMFSALLACLKEPGSESDHSCASDTKIRNISGCTLASPEGLHGILCKYRGNSTFALPE